MWQGLEHIFKSDSYHLMYKYKVGLTPKNNIFTFFGVAGGAVGSGQAVRRPTPRRLIAHGVHQGATAP